MVRRIHDFGVKRRLVRELLDCVEARRDRLVIKRTSPFTRKFYRFNKAHGSVGQSTRPLFRRFFLLMHSSDSVRFIEETGVLDVPQWVSEVVKDDDLYLVETALATLERTIVTTDQPLRDGLHGRDEFRVLLVEDFSAEYLR